MKQHLDRFGLFVLLTALLALNASHAQEATPFYAGKTIEIIVPFDTGGATDVGARFVAPYLQRNIPGNPRVVVNNMPGGASILGANYFEQQSRDDGLLMLTTTSSTSFPYMLGQQGVEYDLATKRVAMTLAFGPVMYVAPETGIESGADLLNPQRPLVYGGIGATASDLPALLAFEVLGLDITPILGFSGRGPVRLAFERGETNLDFQFTQVYLSQVLPQVEAGRAIPIMTGGAADEEGNFVLRDPIIDDLPSVYEVYQELYGEEPSGPAWEAYEAAATLTFQFGLTWWMPENTPEEALEALWEAVVQINADPEFQEEAQAITGGYMLQRGDQTEPLQRRALQLDPEVIDWLRNHLATEYGARF
jgi:tripartite-type tricarboxylate transporter receptor subunit TctC